MSTALVVVDVLNRYEHPDADRLAESARDVTPNVKRLVAFLLRENGVEHVVLAGQVTEQCIFYTALDAHVRGFGIVVPEDAVAHIHPDLAEAALRMMEVNMHARRASTEELVRER